MKLFANGSYIYKFVLLLYLAKMKEILDDNNIPRHIAIIMDGNGRWAKKKGVQRFFGHKNAIEAIRQATEGAAEIGVKYLTLYAFSTENWNRPANEVNALMNLLVSTIRKETNTLLKNNIVLNAVGDIEDLPESCRRELEEAIEHTSHNGGMLLTLALSYGGRKEILNACKKIALDYADYPDKISEIDEKVFQGYLHTANMPDPEMMIRTSGESRISNFLLWQLAYSELVFVDTLWPDFRKKHLHQAIAEYQKRERRFGKTGEQVADRI